MLMLVGVLWLTFLGGAMLAYLDKKFDKWGVPLAIIFVAALVITLLGVMGLGHDTATMN
jgi:hypothetical protein